MTRLVLVGVVCGVLLSGVSIAAQGRAFPQRGQGPAAIDNDAVRPAEIQRMFDAYALMQAQDQLQMTEEQYPRFLARFKALLDVRRKLLVDRTRMVTDLRRLLMEGRPDETQLKERLQELQDLETRSGSEIARAREAIDQVLDVKQQARFRVFEEMMERRKLELVTRARQAIRPKAQR